MSVPEIAKPEKVSYVFIAAILVLVAWLHLGAALIAGLFAYLALTRLNCFKRLGKWVSVVLFILFLAGALYALGFIINQTVHALPEIADNAIPPIIDWARQHHIELPFTDYDSLKDAIMDAVRTQTQYLGSAARVVRGAGSQFIMVLVASVIAIGIFIHPHFETDHEPRPAPNNLYTVCCAALEKRFQTFYGSFATVMGAQVVISAINTFLTAMFVLVTHMPHGIVVVGMTFLCGLLPVIGNLISNTIIVGIGITVSAKLALAALIFLVVVHKLEYFLNSKIVGDRIRNPFWLTLVALILGEKLMGLPGMILAPIILNYIRVETSRFKTEPPPTASQLSL